MIGIASLLAVLFMGGFTLVIGLLMGSTAEMFGDIIISLMLMLTGLGIVAWGVLSFIL